MLRASAACEKAGVPTVTLVCEGFVSQARATARGLGLPGLALGVLPGHTGMQSPEQVQANVRAGTLQQVIEGLVSALAQDADEVEAMPQDVVCSGSFDEVNEYFHERRWSDGLPIVPPTRAAVEAFLRFTDRAPHEVLGVMLPDNRRATPWNVAVNGVMAGCRPEYMPVLMALVEALLDPAYGLEHSGNTPGSETMILLNGPIIKQLGFNYEQGVMRDGIRPNTSIGRFLRLYLRNVAGFLHGSTDKATFGNTWRVVVPENEDEVKRLGWEPHSVSMGFATGDNVVTIGRYTGGNVVASVAGTTPQALMPYIADRMVKEHGFNVCFTVGQGLGSLRPILLLTPVLAETIAKAGWSKRDVQQYLFDHARMTARQFELYANTWTDQAHPTLQQWVQQGKAPRVFAESEDPERLVPIVFRPEDFYVVVTGDPLRTNAFVLSHNGLRGFSVAKKIVLPPDWDRLRAA
ncbi:MAG TPA: UGSC family (seleno)protein [Ramlibacter sp.]|nr:UGSC family (seleno)protein [Ramlibacter sp.]